MIGRWLALLTEQEEDNLLTTKLIPFTAHFVNEEMGCLVGVALRHEAWGQTWGHPTQRTFLWMWWDGQICGPITTKNIAWRFNELCQKLVGVPVRERQFQACARGTVAELEGGARAARLIRARILRHRAQRALTRPQTAPTAPEVALVAV